jgi:hypothetical protein
MHPENLSSYECMYIHTYMHTYNTCGGGGEHSRERWGAVCVVLEGEEGVDERYSECCVRVLPRTHIYSISKASVKHQ